MRKRKNKNKNLENEEMYLFFFVAGWNLAVASMLANTDIAMNSKDIMKYFKVTTKRFEKWRRIVYG